MLSRYNVYRPMLPLWGVPATGFQSTMNRLFQDFEMAFTHPTVSVAPRRPAPRVQLRDQGDAISLFADLPGLRLEDIELTIEGDAVTLKATPKETPIPEGLSPLRRERKSAAFEWSFELPYAVDAGAAAATLEQGRLAVILPKAPEARPRTIPVKAV
jgi:HSP20 family protein